MWILQHIATYCNILQHIATYCNILQHIATYCNILQHIATYWYGVDHDMGLWLSTWIAWIVIASWSLSLCYTVQYNQYKYWGLSLSITIHGNPMKSSQYFHAFADLEDPLPGSDCSQRHVLEIEQRSQKRGGCTWWDEADEVGTNMNEPQASTNISQHQSASIINQPASSDSNQH